MAGLADLLQGILGGLSQRGGPVVTAVGDHANPAAMQAQFARFAMPQGQPVQAPQLPAQGVPAPQAPQAQPQAQPAPQAPQGGGLGDAIGGILQNIVNPQASAKNQTVGWLQKQGLDQGTATLLASNKPALQSYLLQRSKGSGPTEFDQRAAAAAQYGLDPSTAEGRNFILTGKVSGDDALKPTSDIQNYQFAVQNGYKGDFATWAKDNKGGVNVNLSQDGEMFAGMPKDVRDEMFKRQSAAQDAADLINVTGQGLKLLDAGAITGAGSGAKIAAVKWAQALGIDVPADAVNNTEAYRSIMAKAVGKVIKQFGSGTGLSDADRAYAERLAGGDTTLNEPAIRRILAAGVKQAQGEIQRFSTTRDKVLKGDMSALLDVQVPEIPQNIVTPPPPGAPSADMPSFTDNKQVFDGIASGQLKVGDTIILNGKKMRIDP